MDLYARTETRVAPKSVGYIPLNVAIEVPEGYWVLVAPRSSTHKKGLMAANSIGIGDRDFCGNNDEYKMIVYNFTEEEVVVDKGLRIAQFMVCKLEKAQAQDVEFLESEDRGGIGSTGN